ncbi:MAG TPA: Calx-beta domain-containing protein, partial [Xanthomonadales bacterium]|nr:Calx-beta domain-containing protein [Xanthomonadales bacterium]
TLNVGDATSVLEGNAGTTTMTFPVTLTAPAGAGGVSFTASTQDNSATTADNDYVALTNVPFTIAAGNTSTNVTVTINGDPNIEPNETLFLNVANITNANAGDTQGVGQITNDDSPPNLTINDVALAEGNAGPTTFTFTVSLSAPALAGGVTFDIATADGTGTTANNDYLARSLTGQSIPAGSSTYTFDVTVNGDTTNEPNETFLVNVTNVTGAVVTDGQGQGTINNDDPVLTAIHDIQGNNAASPIVGASITTRGIVTGRKSNGFFMQEPDATVDADPATSEGVFVFTSSAPPAAATVGNLVQVTATVLEFVPTQDPLQPPLTELGNPGLVVTQLTTGNPLPAPIPLSPTFPDPAGPVDQLERLEGMRVSVASATATSGTSGTVNEPNATSTNNGIFSAVVTGVARPFREPGIQANDPVPVGGVGTIPPIPRWDFNPELFQVDFDAIGGTIPAGALSTGAIVTGLVGPLDFGFRRYTILPDPTLPTPIVVGGQVPTPVTVPTAREFTVASYNLERFFNDVDDPTPAPPNNEPVLTTVAYQRRLAKASLGIRDFMRTPDVVGVIEVENLATLQDLANRINSDAVAASQPNPLYTARLVEGNDIGGIDVGFLIKQQVVAGTTPRVTINAVVQENAGELFVNADSSTELLNDRPSLRLDAVVNNAAGATFPVTVIVNHLRSLNNIDDNSVGSPSLGWASVGQRVRAKRQKQAESLANLVQQRQIANPGERIILVGDFNAFEFNDGLVDMVDTIKGTPTPDNTTAVPGDGADLVNPDLTLLLDAIATQRYSFLFGGNAQEIDHAIVNQALIAATTARRVEHPRINADFAGFLRGSAGVERNADHDPLVSYYTVAGFATADLAITKTAPATVTAGTNLAYTINVANTGPDPAAAASWTDTLPAGTTFVSLPAVAGWSCTTPAVGATGTVTCTNPTFAVGSAAFTLTVAVAPATAAGTVISNTATTTSTTGDPNTANNSSTFATTVATSADLSIAKVDTPDPVNAGANITYTITATNAGPSNAANAAIADTLPAGTTFVSLASPGGWSCTTPAVGSGGTVNCTNTSFAPGNGVFTLVAAVGAGVANGTVLSNTATISSATSDGTPGNNSATATTTVNASADVSVTLTDAPDPVAPGGSLTYTITVANAGPSNAATVALADTLPANTTFTSLASPAGWSCTTPAVGAAGTVNCTNPSLAAGNSVFTLVVAVGAATPAGTVISDTATVTSASPDGNTANNTATTTTNVASPSALSATKTASGPRTPGSTLTYTIVVRNTGASAQNDNPGNELTDVLPAGLSLVSATASSGTAVATTATNTVTWNGAIAAGGSVTITITAVIVAGPGTTIANQATVSFDGDGNGTNESTVVTDDPGTGTALDPTGIIVQQILAVPANTPLGLLVLVFAIGLLGMAQRRRAIR